MNSPHVIDELPIVVLFPHNRCNCRCVMCDIWRIRAERNLTCDDLRPHLESFRALRVQWVVFSGGEAQLNPELEQLANMLRAEGIRLTLLTAGLLLEEHAEEVCRAVDDLIVSLDGPQEVHDAIRRVPQAFARLGAGVAAVRKHRPEMKITARTTVQRANRTQLRTTVGAARSLELGGISFLAADTTSSAFNREKPWDTAHLQRVTLGPAEVDELEAEIESLLDENGSSTYVAESPQRLRGIVRHFRAALGQCEAVAPRCNAPWVSAVIEADGSVRPCFFQPKLGNINDVPLIRILNSPESLRFRERLDVATDEICRRCVCSLYREVPVSAPASTG